MDVDNYGDQQAYGASRARRGGQRRDDPYSGGGGGGGGYDDYSRGGGGGGGGYDHRRGGRGGRGGGGRGGRGSKPYDRQREGGRGDDEYHHQMEDPSGALTFRQFAFKHLPNDATPQEAEEKYEQYKIENAHLFHEQYFMRQKNDPWMQRTFDPRLLESNQGKRLELAKEQSEKFAKGFAEIGSVEGLPDYSEATTEAAADGGEENMETEDPEKKAKRARRIGGFVPREAWHMDRLKHDLTVARSLIEKLNSEKEIPNSPELANALQNNVSINAKSSAEDIAKAIDTCVVYLWNVHGIDYYGGRETNPHDYIEIAEGRNVRAKCSFRKPLSTFALGGGEHAVPADAPIEPIEANEIATKWSKRVDSTWSERLTCLSDPVVLRLVDEADLENRIEEWIKAQVVVFDESRFGSTLSSKLFIAEEFVLKHIKTKQTEAIEKERNRLIDEKYKENVFEYLRAEEAKGNKPTLRGIKRGGSGGGRGGGRGGRGGRRGRGGGRGPYTDLDATTNERVVIDYGEI
ncbi:unnamed protein product [Bathycoccus prasinos]